MVASFVLATVLVAQHPAKLRDSDVPVPSTLAYGAISDSELLLCQVKNKELQWFCPDLHSGILRSLKETHPEVHRKLGLGSCYGAPGLVGGPVGEALVPVHKFRIGFGYLWLTQQDQLLRRGRCGLFRVKREGHAHVPQTKAFLAALPPGHRQSDVTHAPGEVVKDSGENTDIEIGSMGFLVGEADHMVDTMEGDRYAYDMDIVPLDPQRVVLLNWVNRELSIWEYRFSIVRTNDSALTKSKGTWLRVALIKAPFGECFHLAAEGASYYLVADSGTIYAVSKLEEKWTITKHWDDKGRPIRAMLTSPDGIGAYVFGKDFYFKVGQKIDVKPCRDVTKRDPKESNKDLEQLVPAARLAYECGRVLYENGELKPATGKQ